MSPVDTSADRRPVGGIDIPVESRLTADWFYPLPYVASARFKDGIVLMNRRTQTYFTLDAVGSRIWELIGAHAAVSTIVRRLFDQYDVPHEQIAADVATTLRRFLADRLITPGVGPKCEPATHHVPDSNGTVNLTKRKFRVPSVLRCALLILAVKTALKRCGFDATLRFIARRVQEVPATVEADFAAVKAGEHAMALAGAFYPGRAKCLEQSLALYCLLRQQGVAATYCQGVQLHPFEAHAWIEYQGEVVNDVAEHVKHFVRFQNQLP
jgi:hypothetical protein